MRILLDTNVLIHREAKTSVREDIGPLFRWLDRLTIEKCIHPDSVAEIQKHADESVRRTLGIKLGSYSVLKTRAADTADIRTLRAHDITPNDSIDTNILAEIAAGRVDALITEDRGIHRKAARIGLASSVFTIDGFLEKATAENPELADYRVLAVRKLPFGAINLQDSFFDSFREDYPGFDRWFNRKSDEVAYVCTSEEGNIVAFLYLKRESPGEDYSDLTPPFRRAVRLKIGTFKVVANGYKLGERFLKIIFDNALANEVDEIYVTIFRRTEEQERLIQLLGDWGFEHYGYKDSVGGREEVLVRHFQPNVNGNDPRRTYPYISRTARKFIVPIRPPYHTELLPDSILRTESPDDFVENKPNRNAISKVYISRSIERGLHRGDIIVFYRTKADSGPAHHTAVATTIGVVQEVVTTIPDLATFVALCRKRSVFTDGELADWWNYNPRNRPFIVNFLYVYSLPKRPNLGTLKDEGIIADAPRGFEPLSDTGFNRLLQIANANEHFVVD